MEQNSGESARKPIAMLNEEPLQMLHCGTFYDVPRGIVLKVGQNIVVLRCEFDEDTDQYKDFYSVYLKIGADDDDYYSGRFNKPKHPELCIGELPLKSIVFDLSKRKSLKCPSLKTMIDMANNNVMQILSYGTYSEIPRGVIVKVSEKVIQLRCEFDDTTDSYQDHYDVYLLVGATTDDFYSGMFYERTYEKMFIGRLSIKNTTFDVSGRRSLKSPALVTLVNSFEVPTSP